jgi:hypothetical protein
MVFSREYLYQIDKAGVYYRVPIPSSREKWGYAPLTRKCYLANRVQTSKEEG